MTTVLDKNVHNVSVGGTFDDCQDLLKGLFANKTFTSKYNLGAVNSINWARILAQTVYYFHSYFTLLRSLDVVPGSEAANKIHITYSVPTGNFGDILAGYYAHQMGLPTSKLLVATNANDILYRFFNTGICSKGDDGVVRETLSPAMDIVVSSNFERLLFYLARDVTVDASVPESEKDVQAGKIVEGWMLDLKQKGSFDTGNGVLAKAKEIFDAGHVSDEEVKGKGKNKYNDKMVSRRNVLHFCIQIPHSSHELFSPIDGCNDPQLLLPRRSCTTLCDGPSYGCWCHRRTDSGSQDCLSRYS